MQTDLTLEALLQAYCPGPQQLRQALAGLQERDLDLSLDGQGWTIRQVVHHVVDGDDLWQAGLLAALGSPQSFDLHWYWSVAQDEWVKAWHYAERPITPALDFFEANRQRAALILRAVPRALHCSVPVQWPDGSTGDLSVRDILEMQTRHVSGHIQDIEHIRQAREV